MDSETVRPATKEDLPALLDIYNDVIATSTAVHALAPTTLTERTNWFDARTSAGYPVLVAMGNDDVIGFATFGEFRGTWPGYRYSVEHTVHVRRDQRGMGVGSRLMHALFPIAAGMNRHVMIGAVDAENASSRRFHARLGFDPVAHFREVGHKFGRWLDLISVQCFLDPPGAALPD